jgi:hypothetical protein
MEYGKHSLPAQLRKSKTLNQLMSFKLPFHTMQAVVFEINIANDRPRRTFSLSQLLPVKERLAHHALTCMTKDFLMDEESAASTFNVYYVRTTWALSLYKTAYISYILASAPVMVTKSTVKLPGT